MQQGTLSRARGCWLVNSAKLGTRMAGTSFSSAMSANVSLSTCHLVESKEMVTGPSLSRDTFMKAPKRPFLTFSGLYSLPILATKLSHRGAAFHGKELT